MKNKQFTKNRKNVSYILLMIIEIIGMIGVILVVIIAFFVFNLPKKLVCTADDKSITIMYKDNKIVDYVADGVDFDLEAHQNTINQVGIDAFFSQYDYWFRSNTSGYCVRKNS